jgi:hypothetical protein
LPNNDVNYNEKQFCTTLFHTNNSSYEHKITFPNFAREGGRDDHGKLRSVSRLLANSTLTKLPGFECGLLERIELLLVALDCFLLGVSSEGIGVVLVLLLEEFGVLTSSFFGAGVDLSSNGSFRLGVCLCNNHNHKSYTHNRTKWLNT